MTQRKTHQSRKQERPGLSTFISILLILPAWILVSCYTTIDRQYYRFSETGSDLWSYRDEIPDLPVSYRLLATIPESSNTLVLESDFTDLNSLRDYIEHQHHSVCLYDPRAGVLGARKQVPHSRLELIVFYRMSGRFIKVNASWHKRPNIGSISLNMIDSVIKMEHTPTMWASADRTVSVDRPVRRSDNPDRSEVNRGRVEQPRNTGGSERRSRRDESQNRNEVDRQKNDNQRSDNHGKTAPKIPAYPPPSPPRYESAQPSPPSTWSPVTMPRVFSKKSWEPAILQKNILSDHSVAFAHTIHFIRQIPHSIIRYEYNRFNPDHPINDPCNIDPRQLW